MWENGQDQRGSVTEDSSTGMAHSEHLRLANILDQMPVGIGVFDSAGQLFHSNQHFERTAGGAISSLHAMHGQYWQPVSEDGAPINEISYPGIRALNGQVATPGVDFIRRTSDGRDHWVSVSAVPLTAADAVSVVGVVMVVEEAQQQRRFAERLRAQRERFLQFAKYSSHALWMADTTSGELQYLSPAAEKLWPECIMDASLKTLAAHTHADDVDRVAEHRRQATGGPVQRFEYRIVNPVGDVIRRVRETCFPIPGEQGCHDCLGGVVEDISPEIQIYLVQPGPEQSDLFNDARLRRHRVKTFASHADLTKVADVLNPGCVVVDLRRSTADWPSIAAILSARPADLQVVLLGAANTPMRDAMDAMRAGAADFLLEPFTASDLERAIETAAAALPSQFDTMRDEPSGPSRLTELSPRERDVLNGLVDGGTNKTIARALGISPRTVEVHRAHLMERLNVRSLSELLQLAHDSGLKAAVRS